MFLQTYKKNILLPACYDKKKEKKHKKLYVLFKKALSLHRIIKL